MHLQHPLRCCSALALLCLLGLRQSAQAQDSIPAGAKCIAVHGAALQMATAGGWTSVAAKSIVPADRMVVALFGAEFESNDGAVGMKMVADVGQRGPFPVLEAAVVFHATGSDLNVTLDRGIVVFRNLKKAGAAKLKLRVRGEVFDVILSDPQSKLGIEVYGRHVPGPAQLDDPKDDDPVTNAVFVALEGHVVISNEKHATGLQAPPGRALYLWDNLTRTPEVRYFDKLPDSMKPMSAAEATQFQAVCELAKPLAERPGEVGKILRQDLHAKDPLQRKVGVVGLGALDDLPGLVQAMSNPDHADVRDTAILAVRHWLGRAPGQSIRLYQQLTKAEGYTPVQAKSFLHLCRGIDPARRKQPTTYELLIGGLNHSKMPMRELAHWHLVRLAPAGKSIPYDAAAGEPQRLQAIEAWRRLIPDGELPPAPKKN